MWERENFQHCLFCLVISIFNALSIHVYVFDKDYRDLFLFEFQKSEVFMPKNYVKIFVMSLKSVVTWERKNFECCLFCLITSKKNALSISVNMLGEDCLDLI